MNQNLFENSFAIAFSKGANFRMKDIWGKQEDNHCYQIPWLLQTIEIWPQFSCKLKKEDRIQRQGHDPWGRKKRTERRKTTRRANVEGKPNTLYFTVACKFYWEVNVIIRYKYLVDIICKCKSVFHMKKVKEL